MIDLIEILGAILVCLVFIAGIIAFSILTVIVIKELIRHTKELTHKK